MFQNIWFVAAIWMGLALVASLVSIWTGISVALIEILGGVIAGNFLHLQSNNEWIGFLAMLGSGVLTFLAGAEIDPRSLKANLRASALIGIISFAVPFGLVWLFAQFILGWPLHQAQIAGIALSTTSVAVVYAVMIEGGYSDTAMGKMIPTACFITDFGTVLALGGLFANFNVWLVVFVVVMCVVLWFMPMWTKSIIDKLGTTRVSEPEVKFILFVLFFLGGLATTAKSEAVLPAYLVGLVVAGVFLRDKTLVHRMRSIAFAVFTPFYFIRAGSYVSLAALWPALFIVLALLLLKMVTKTVGVWPLARMHFMSHRQATYTTLLMATGLTFGTISALFGFQNHIIDQRQYTILVTVVILSAFVPTLFAQKLFQPTKQAMHAWGRLYRRRSGRSRSRTPNLNKLPNPPPGEIKDNHRRSISVSLQVLDKALCEWEQWIVGHISGGVMYQQQDTLSTTEKNELRSRVDKLRQGITQLCGDLNLTPAKPNTSQLITAQATILWEMLAELNSSSLRGYGAVSPQLSACLDPIGEDLTQQMHEISRFFSRASSSRAKVVK